MKRKIEHLKVDTYIDPELQPLFDREQVKGIIDMLWNKGQKELNETNTWPSYRGRFTCPNDGVAYWVYNHQAPTPLLAIVGTKEKSNELWELIRSEGGQRQSLEGTFALDTLVKESKEAQNSFFHTRNDTRK